MPFKYDAQGQIVTADHNGIKLPVFVHPDGKEAPFDADGTINSINARAEQSRRVEGENKTLKEQLAAFDGLDAVKAREAIEKMSTVDLSKMVHAGEVEKVKGEIAKTYEAKLAAKDQEMAQKDAAIWKRTMDAAFNGSKFIGEKVAIPAQFLRSTYAQHFKPGEDGEPVGYFADGRPIMSSSTPTKFASFDEAMESIIASDPHKASILKGSGASGGGATGGGSGGGNGKTQISRAAWQALSPLEQRAKATDPKVEIVD